MANYQITCVVFSVPGRRDSGISDYGNHRGPKWIMAKIDATKTALAGNRFFTNETGVPAWANYIGSGSSAYLQTESDPYDENNLVNLEVCPAGLPRRYS